MAPPKSKHKHCYVMHAVERDEWPGRFSLVNICSVCGKHRAVEFKQQIVRTEAGGRIWLSRLEDIQRSYEGIPVIYKQGGASK